MALISTKVCDKSYIETFKKRKIPVITLNNGAALRGKDNIFTVSKFDESSLESALTIEVVVRVGDMT